MLWLLLFLSLFLALSMSLWDRDSDMDSTNNRGNDSNNDRGSDRRTSLWFLHPSAHPCLPWPTFPLLGHAGVAGVMRQVLRGWSPTVLLPQIQTSSAHSLSGAISLS